MTENAAPQAVAHDLRIEQGGRRMERFIYAWCPCGWVYHADAQSDFAGDDCKRRFATHLGSLSGR